MKIAILAAMDKELALMRNLMGASHDVLLAKCGIGKVNAALNALRIIREFRPDLVINSGVAGGTGSLGIGSLLVADSVAYHDVWCGPGTMWGTADGFERFFLPSPSVIETAREHIKDPRANFGLIATGDTFISKAEEVARIKEVFPEAMGVDMESAAIAQTCSSEGVPFGIIRVVSDTPGQGENISQYRDFWSKAPETTFHALETILCHL